MASVTSAVFVTEICLREPQQNTRLFRADYEDEGERWMGIVPFSPNYALGGKAWDRNAITYPHCLSQAVREIPAHEMVHLFGIDHAPCNDTSSSLEDIDDDLRREIPNGRTEDVGFDVMGCRWRDSGCGAIPAGVGDLMSYCNSQRTWPSIALWLMLRDKIG